MPKDSKKKVEKPKVPKWRKKQLALLDRAAMDVFMLNTGVVCSTDELVRIGTAQGMTPSWGDCVRIEWMCEGQPHWYYGHFSPARARLLAYAILARCDALEKATGTESIDKTPNKVP